MQFNPCDNIFSSNKNQEMSEYLLKGFFSTDWITAFPHEVPRLFLFYSKFNELQPRSFFFLMYLKISYFYTDICVNQRVNPAQHLQKINNNQFGKILHKYFKFLLIPGELNERIDLKYCSGNSERK